MLYFGGGEGETIINEHDLGWVAEAGNYDHLNSVIESLDTTDARLHIKKGIQQRAYKSFDFNIQLNELKKEL